MTMSRTMKDIFDDPPPVVDRTVPHVEDGYASDGVIDTEPLPHTHIQNQQPPMQTMDRDVFNPVAVVQTSPAHDHQHQQRHQISQHPMSFGQHQQHHRGNSSNMMPPQQSAQAGPWGGDHGVRHPGDKPKRPLSAYNFFFQLERERIINSDEADRDKDVAYTVEDVARIALVQQKKAKENKPKEKRSHRKTHGKISFGDLARTIANKWKKLDDQSKSIFEGSASIEKERYRKELAEWTKQQKKWKEATSKMASNMTLQHAQKNMMYGHHQDMYNLVTPPQMPKKTISAGNNDCEQSDMMRTMAAQQKILNSQGGSFGGIDHQRRATLGGGKQQMQSDNFNQNSRRFSTGMMPYGSQYQSSYGRGDFSGMYGNGGDDEDFFDGNNPQLSNDMANGGNGSGYDQNFDDVAEDTYNMAAMTLPRPKARNGGNGKGSAAFHRRMMMNQRRMRMMMIQQQRQQLAAAGMGGGNSSAMMRQQMLMMQQPRYFGGMDGLIDAPFNGDEQQLHSRMQQRDMPYMDQHLHGHDDLIESSAPPHSHEDLSRSFDDTATNRIGLDGDSNGDYCAAEDPYLHMLRGGYGEQV